MDVVEVNFERGQLLRETRFLYHNSAFAHSAMLVKHLIYCDIAEISHILYSPDLAPTKFFVFHKCKLFLMNKKSGRKRMSGRKY
jgi:hypothetical protein